ncbi:TPR end-of-group domain-containing protein [Arcobacter arenosus]|uniref:TPR end-of-group domain-containing protein n=1 Tax=Arcobacter arenosus TaxID=2576037 RepID=UPI003BA9FBAD
MKRLLLLILISSLYLFANIKNIENEKNLKEKINTLEKSLYTPFVENYILNEIKQLREENRDLKVELHKTLAKKEIEMSSNVINYATSTINNMFYIIAAASSILVIIGWSSIKDINDKIKNMVDEKTSKTIQKYEEKMAGFEQDLAKRARQVKHNENEIKIMNTIHSLWLRASQETTPTGKIEAYDEILDIRPNEVEALIYKADAVLDIGEANWSLNLVNQALLIDKNYPSAYFQRAKAYAVLEYEDSAIDDLQKAIQLNEEYATKIETEEEFEGILKNERVKQIVV